MRNFAHLNDFAQMEAFHTDFIKLGKLIFISKTQQMVHKNSNYDILNILLKLLGRKIEIYYAHSGPVIKRVVEALLELVEKVKKVHRLQRQQ